VVDGSLNLKGNVARTVCIKLSEHVLRIHLRKAVLEVGSLLSIDNLLAIIQTKVANVLIRQIRVPVTNN